MPTSMAGLDDDGPAPPAAAGDRGQGDDERHGAEGVALDRVQLSALRLTCTDTVASAAHDAGSRVQATHTRASIAEGEREVEPVAERVERPPRRRLRRSGTAGTANPPRRSDWIRIGSQPSPKVSPDPGQVGRRRRRRVPTTPPPGRAACGGRPVAARRRRRRRPPRWRRARRAGRRSAGPVSPARPTPAAHHHRRRRSASSCAAARTRNGPSA